jgi:hypothetical protein
MSSFVDFDGPGAQEDHLQMIPPPQHTVPVSGPARATLIHEVSSVITRSAYITLC